MDFTSRGIAWIGKIGENLVNLFSEVDARSKEQLDFVESQLQIAGENLKQFCSEFIQEMLPASLSDAEEETYYLSSEQNRKVQHPASELSNISVEEDNRDELSHSSSSSLVLPVETTEGVHVHSSLQPRADKSMNMSVEDNLGKTLSFGKSSGVVAFTEETLKMSSLFCEADKRVEGPAKSSTIASSVECLEFDPSMQEGKTVDFTDLGANTSKVPSLTCSTCSTESQESAFPEINSCAALPVVSNDNTGASVDRHVRQPAIDSVPEVEFDGNCVLVDKDDLASGSKSHGVHISHKKIMPRLKVKPGKQRNKDATKCEDPSLEVEQSNAECKTIFSKREHGKLSQEGFCESDWEII